MTEFDALTPSIIWYTGPDGVVRRANPSWEAFTGQNFAAHQGLGWLDAVHPDDRERVTRTWLDGVQAGHPIQLHYRLRRHDGAWRHMTAHGAPPAGAGGAVSEWVGVCIDLTDSLLAQAALRESEARLRLLDQLGHATRQLTDATQIMKVTAQMLGESMGATRCAYADVEADGDRFTIRSDWSLPGVPSSAGVYSLDLFGPQATSNLRAGRHLVVCDVDGELGEEGGGRMFKAIGIQAIICAGLVKDGRLVAMMAVHQAQARRWTAQEVALVGEVVERCWAHIERVRDNAMLREQDRRKDEFLATLAHELRNPLAPIKYAVAMMRMRKEPAVRTQAQDVVDRQVSLMARLIDDLLDLSRISRGMIHLQREPVSLAALMEQAVETVRPMIAAANHQLEVTLPERDAIIDADPARIVQVIGNLLNNAAKYTRDGGRIRLSARRVEAQVVLEVADNGVGIPPEEQGKLFQMFTQLQHTASRAQGGLGIGLSLVKHLVEMHGGSVAATSRGINQGTTFTVRLPTYEAPVASTPAPTAEPGPAAPQPTRVLVVEDNVDGRETLLALLEMLGHEVAGAADGQQALDQARSFRPDIVLLDLGLPVIDGLEVARRLRADPSFQDTYIVALTGWGADSDQARTSQAGFNAHLTKPVEMTLLEQVLADAVHTSAR